LMLDYCAFSKDHKCIKWEDYQIMLQEIEEADSLCHGNWIEIEKQYNYILELQKILDEHGIGYPVLL
ncbi:mobility-associated LCxxNW protein, partial [Butyrivibrio sp.]|uniref:mobility-associated LCxxNW protein n=1 Tax=Butyrivibrio sp. TaxID=28121 RepID=UPI002ECFAF03